MTSKFLVTVTNVEKFKQGIFNTITPSGVVHMYRDGELDNGMNAVSISFNEAGGKVLTQKGALELLDRCVGVDSILRTAMETIFKRGN